MSTLPSTNVLVFILLEQWLCVKPRRVCGCVQIIGRAALGNAAADARGCASYLKYGQTLPLAAGLSQVLEQDPKGFRRTVGSRTLGV